MGLSVDIHLAQKQKLVVTQTLREAIELLQMSSLELQDRIEQELEQNPVLELREPGNDDSAGEGFEDSGADGGFDADSGFEARESATEIAENAFGDGTAAAGDGSEGASDLVRLVEEPGGESLGDGATLDLPGNAVDEAMSDERSLDFLDSFADSSDSGFHQGQGRLRDPDAKQQFIEGTLNRGETFTEHLLQQLRFATWNEEDYKVGEILVSCLDEDGYLKEDVGAIAESSPVDGRGAEDFRRLHELIKTFDPPGVAAADIRECLLLQLADLARGEGDRVADPAVLAAATAVVRDGFDLLEKHAVRPLAARIGRGLPETEEALAFLAQLEPRPGRKYSTKQVQYVVPDVIVREVEGEFVIIINDDWIPSLAISDRYRQMLKAGRMKKEDKSYLHEKIGAAQWLLRSIAQRRATLYLVTDAILKEQIEFFRRGPGHLKPLTLRDIAEKIGMHESTVSRVTSNKYMQTPWGVVSQKYFFSSSLRKADGQVESSRSVKDLIKKIIEQEGKGEKTAYSDQEIVGILQNKGIKIARRTVAKYRKMLKILPSSHRRG